MRWRRRLARVSLPVLLGFAQVALAYPTPVGQRDRKLLQIQQSIEDHDLAKARRLLAEAENEFPADAGFDNLRGVVEANTGDYAAAESNFRKAVDRDPKFTGAYLNLGRLYQERLISDTSARGKALLVYGRILEYEPENAEAHYQSAALLLQQHQYGGSLEHVLRLPSESKSTAQAVSILCADYAALGNGNAADEAAKLLKASPDFSEQDAQQALPGLVAGKRDDLIISLLENLHVRQKLSPETVRDLGLAYERSGKFAEARATLDDQATQSPSMVLLLDLSRIAYKQQDYRGSLGYLAHARDIEPANASVHYDFGWVCLELALIAEARASFQKAVELEPDNASYNYAMGIASSFRQDPEDAIPYFEKYLKLKPHDLRGNLAIGIAFWRSKNYDAAIPWLRQATEASETAPSAHYYLGSTFLQMHRPDDAFPELELAVQARPDYADAWAQLGQYYLQRKDYEQAERQLRRALEIDPDHYSANFYLLTLYTRTGDARREAQAKHFDDLKNLVEQKAQDLLRVVEVRPFETP